MLSGAVAVGALRVSHAVSLTDTGWLGGAEALLVGVNELATL